MCNSDRKNLERALLTFREHALQKGSHILTTQSHPEFSYEFMDALLIDCKGKIGDQYLNYAKKTLSKSQNGQIFSTWATEFFLENIN